MRLKIILVLRLFCASAWAQSVPAKNGYFNMEYSWKYNEVQWSFSVSVPEEVYDFYRERTHYNDDLIHFVLSEYDRDYIREIVKSFREGGKEWGLSDIDNVFNVVSFVQSLQYVSDEASRGEDEYIRYPIETLVDGCGDCEDKVALLAALLYEMDVDFILLVLPEHMAVGVHCNEVDAERYLLFREKKYYYLETTMEGWQIGQIPEDYHDAEMEAVPVDDNPSLLIEGVRFESQPTLVFHKAVCDLELDLHNLGPGKVTELQVQVQVIEKGKKARLLAEAFFPLDDLREGETRTETLSFKSLIKENCVLQVELTSAEVAPLSYQVGLNYSRTEQ